MSRLLHIDGDRVVRQIELREERYTLGRGADCDLVFDASKVSRHHATLKREGADDYLLIDENSSNHVYVNGEQIKRRRLMAGDMISLSRKIKLLYLEDAAARSRMATVQRRIEQATTEQDFLSLKSLTRRIVALDDLQGILQIILRQVVAVVDANRGFIALTDERGTIERETAVTVGIELDSSGMPTGFSKSIAADVIAKRQRLFVMRRQDVDSQGSLSQSVISLDLRSVMCAPLIFDQRLCGLLYVDSASQQTDFDELRQLFFVLLADQAAIAIENAKAAQLGRLSLRRAEQQAAESEQRYEQLVRLSPDAVLVFGRDKILFANPAASRLLGGEKRRAPLTGSSPHSFVESGSLELFGQLPLGEGRAFQIDELTLLDIDGKQIAVELVGTPLYFHGKPAAMAMFRDIRQRKQIEKERIKTQKLESLGVLAGGIAHDFNNILAGVMGNISLAREPNISAEELEESLAEAAEASIRARDLAKQLLTFAKGGSPIKKSHAISNLIREAARFGLRGSNVRCDLQLPEDLWPVDIDEGQILQVLHNIVINANQAMPTGGVLTIRAENRELDDEPTGSGFGRRVAVTLSDQGPGVPAESRARIFDPYFTTKDDGSGLGLAIAYSIARKHGGKLELLDTKSGATFRLTLPAAKGRLIALDPRSAAEQTTTMGGRILVVDDEPAVRKVAARILRKVGFEVECAETGEAAVERIKELGRASIDLVLLDLTIPGGMGGTETLDCLRAIDPHLKAIVFSGYSNNPVLASYRDYGFDGMVGKPFDLPQLTKTIRQVLKTDRKDATTTA